MSGAYGALSDYENREKNLDHSLNCILQAQSIYTVDDFPLFFAGSNKNKGKIYIGLSQFVQEKQYIKKALDCFLIAKEIYDKNGLMLKANEIGQEIKRISKWL